MPYELLYPDYIDKSTGKTLVVIPGSAYTIAIAPGRVASAPAFPNDGRWTSASAFVAMEFEAPPERESVLRTAPVVTPSDTGTDKTTKEGA